MQKVDSLSDEAVINLVIKGNKEFYEQIVKRYQKKLLRYAHYLANDTDLAQDIVQQAFIKAYINLNSFNIKRKFSSWIYRIVHNEAINMLKRDNRNISLEANLWLRDLLEGGERVEEEVEKKELVKMVKSSLSQLPLNYRSPLTLFYLEEKSYEEISEVLKIPIGTVGTRIARGKRILKDLFIKNGGKAYAWE